MSLQIVPRIRWLNKQTFLTALASNFCYNKNLNSQPEGASSFEGYTQQPPVRFNSCKPYRRTSRQFSSQINSTDSSESELDAVQYDKVSEQTLDSLTEYFDEVIEQAEHLQDADVSYGDGVLTIKLGDDYGTYVINRQTPNKQIWLSSPKSGPKRYDFIAGRWIYKHDGKTMHQLLDDEIPAVVKGHTAFHECMHGGGKSSVNSQ